MLNLVKRRTRACKNLIFKNGCGNAFKKIANLKMKMIMKRSKELAKMLNELLEKNYDTEKVFKNAADDVKNERLKTFFKEKAMQRYDFGHELKAEIRSFGESPDEGSSFEGDAHRAWMNLKVAFSSDKEEAVLEELVRAEKEAVEDYNKMIKADGFPPTTANLLIKQRNAIERSLTEVKELEEMFD